MRILVTGGAGYVGSRTSALLLQAGHEVTILDDFRNCASDLSDRVAAIACHPAPIRLRRLPHGAP